MKNIIEEIEKNPIIAAVRREEDAQAAAQSQVSTVFLLHGDIFNVKTLVDMMKANNKSVFIHVDFLEGIGKDNRAIDYIADVIAPDGILTTKSSHVKYSKEKGMFTIQRFFLIDSLSYDTTIKTANAVRPDMIEVMPAVMPGVIKRISGEIPLPVIAGGLIESKEDIIEILKSGALGVSTGNKDLWVL